MSDTYQAVYDAVRSRIGSVDTRAIVEEAARNGFDFSYMRHILQQDFSIAAAEMQRPCAIFRPTLAPDGDQWCALFGENIATGVVGFGRTPAEAMADFDHNWHNQRTPAAIRSVVDPTP